MPYRRSYSRKYSRGRARRGTSRRYSRGRFKRKGRSSAHKQTYKNTRAIYKLKADQEVKYMVSALYPDATTCLPAVVYGSSGQLSPRTLYVDSYGRECLATGVPNGKSFCPNLLPSAKGLNAQDVDTGLGAQPANIFIAGSRIGREIVMKSLSCKINARVANIAGPAATSQNVEGDVKFHAMLVLDRAPLSGYNQNAGSHINMSWKTFKESVLDDTLQNAGSDHMFWNTRDSNVIDRFKILTRKSVVISRQKEQIQNINVPPSPDLNTLSHTKRGYAEITLFLKGSFKFTYPIENFQESTATPEGRRYSVPRDKCIRLLCWTEPLNIGLASILPVSQEVCAFVYMTKIRFVDS